MRALLLPVLLSLAAGICAAPPGAKAEYVGGTVAALENSSEGYLQTTDNLELVFHSREPLLRVPYDHVNLIEYGQKVDRRHAMAAIVSPLLLLSKKRRHFLTVGYIDGEGRQQAAVFRVDKNHIRSVLVSLEARTGRKVQFQDDEARKAGKG